MIKQFRNVTICICNCFICYVAQFIGRELLRESQETMKILQSVNLKKVFLGDELETALILYIDFCCPWGYLLLHILQFCQYFVHNSMPNETVEAARVEFLNRYIYLSDNEVNVFRPASSSKISDMCNHRQIVVLCRLQKFLLHFSLMS